MTWWQYLLVIIIGIVSGWVGAWIRMRLAHRNLELQRLYDARSEMYMDVIDPYIKTFLAAKSAQAQKQLEQQMVSYEYRKAMTELVLLGSDEVVHAVNEFMAAANRMGAGSIDQQRDLMSAWGGLYLAIRRDLGNRSTRLGSIDVLRHSITDIDDLNLDNLSFTRGWRRLLHEWRYLSLPEPIQRLMGGGIAIVRKIKRVGSRAIFGDRA